MSIPCIRFGSIPPSPVRTGYTGGCGQFLVMRDTGFRPGEVAGLSRECYLPRLHGIYTMQSVNIHRELRKRIKTTGKGFGYKVGIITK